MKSDNNKKHILLIDHQPYWHAISTNALRRNSFIVSTLNIYYYLSSKECIEDKTHDLVVLVLSPSLSWQTMHKLFLKGVDDIVDKPYNPAKLVKIVKEVLVSIPCCNEHQAVERNGAA